MDYYKDHKIRHDQVYAMEVVSTFSREEDINIEAWKKKNVEWLQKTFNQAGDGRNNIASVVFHADETGNVPCHAIVVPIAPRGRLNTKHYDMIPSSRTQKYKNLLGGILCPEKVKLMQ